MDRWEIDGYKLADWLIQKEQESKQKKKKHNDRNSHEWRYAGKVEAYLEVIGALESGKFEFEKVTK